MTRFLTPPPSSPVEPGPVPTFSVIIAAYQAADTVGEAVASALDQTLPPHEVIVCDDGSTDDIESALEPHRERIVFIPREHGGVASARNAAIRAASGDFMLILNADDTYLPERLEALGALAAARPDLDILTTDAYIELRGRTIGRYYSHERFVVDDQRRGIIESEFIFGGTATRRKILLAAGGFDESFRTGEDRECWMRLIMAGSRAGLVAEPLYRYRRHLASLSADRARSLRALMQGLEKTRSQFELTPDEERLVQRCLTTISRDVRLTETDFALRQRDPEATNLAIAVARSSDFTHSTRLKAALSAIAPRVAARYLQGRSKPPRDASRLNKPSVDRGSARSGRTPTPPESGRSARPRSDRDAPR